MFFSDTKDAFKVVIALIIIEGFGIVLLNGVSAITLFYKWQSQPKKRGSRMMPDKLIKTSLCTANFTTGAAVVVEFVCYAAGEEGTSTKIKVLAFIILFSVVASLLHVILLSLERFVYIRFPFRYMELKNRTVIILLIITWLVSGLLTCTILIKRSEALKIISTLLLVTDIFLLICSVYIIRVTRRVLSQQNNRILDVSNPENKNLEKQITMCWCATVACYLLFTIPPICVLIARRGQTMEIYLGSETDGVIFIIILMKAIVDPILFILISQIKCKFFEKKNESGTNLKTIDTTTLSQSSNLCHRDF